MNVLTRADVERLWHQEDEDWEKVPPEVRDAIHGVADEMLSRWPEGWEMRPKEPNGDMIKAANKKNRINLMGSGDPPTGKEYWRAMWDAAKAEADDE